jgi:hypothetical protein
MSSRLIGINPMTRISFGFHSVVRWPDEVRMSDSEFESRVQPSCMVELSRKELDIFEIDRSRM